MKLLIGKKIGMTQIYDQKTGVASVVTVLDVSGNVISKVLKTSDKLTHIEIGKDKKKKSIKADVGNYKELGFVPLQKSVLRIEGDNNFVIGKELDLTEYKEGKYVDITGYSKGKGFAGVVKRYGMKGGPRTHGQSDRERAIGSIGMRTIPGRVWKGKRMAGHMGADKFTIKNLKIVKADLEDKLLLVGGSVPGANGDYVLIKSN